MVKLSLVVILSLLLCLSSAQARSCARTCHLMFRCTPYYKQLIWAIENESCRVFQNGCLFAVENCSRANSCRQELVGTTRDKCKERCNQICPFGGSGVCATFAETNAAGEGVTTTKTFLNRCLLDQYACQHERAYVGEPTEGECR